MAPVLAFATGVAGLMSAGASYSSGRAAKRQAKANAKLAQMQSDEEQARFKADQKQQMGLARARAAASMAGGETVSSFLEALSSAGDNQLNWLKMAGDARVDAAETAGDVAYANAMGGVFSTLSKTGTNVYDILDTP